jgi:arylsulfatase A-like enzyme
MRSRGSLAAALLAAAALFACAGEPEPEATAWRQHDLWLAAAEAKRGSFGTYQGRALRSLPVAGGETLRFRLELAAKPYLSFRAIAEAGAACRFEVGFEDSAGGSRQLYAAEHDALGKTLPDAVAVDLAALADQTGTLVLSVSDPPGAGCTGHWGSPRVVDAIPRPSVRAPAQPHVLLLAADTLRADALGAYGASPSVTPSLDAFAAQSQVWLDAFATANNTNPSLASLMTGLYPKDHGLFDLRTQLPSSRTTLAEYFQAAGYETLGIVSAAHLKNAGLDQGFDRLVRPGGQFFAETVVDMAIDWLQTERAGPTFAWLHFFDPHVPHNPPASYARGLAPAAAFGMGPVRSWAPFRDPGPVEFDARAPRKAPGHRKLYPGEVAYLDRELGRLIDFLRSRGRLDTTIVAFVADHGETLGERNSWFRHGGLFDETTHVPLMIRWPGGEPRGRIEGLVQHFDLFATLLEVIGVRADSDARLLDATPARDAVFANHANDEGSMVRTPSHLFIFERAKSRRPRGPRFFDLASDPAARNDLSGRDDPLEKELADRLRAWRATKRIGDRAQPVEIGEAERARLRELGYGE